MCHVLRAELLGSLRNWIARERCQPDEARLKIVWEGGLYVASFCRREMSGGEGSCAPSAGRPPHPMTEPSTPPPPTVAHDGLWLSPIEEKILDFLAKQPAQHFSSDAIAAAVGAKCSDGFKALLTNLADRKLIEPLSGKGYRIRPGLVSG